MAHSEANFARLLVMIELMMDWFSIHKFNLNIILMWRCKILVLNTNLQNFRRWSPRRAWAERWKLLEDGIDSEIIALLPNPSSSKLHPTSRAAWSGHRAFTTEPRYHLHYGLRVEPKDNLILNRVASVWCVVILVQKSENLLKIKRFLALRSP